LGKRKLLRTIEERRGIGWWKLGMWGLKWMRRNTDQGICAVCRKEEGWSHILQCEGTRNWREKLLGKTLQVCTWKLELER
jgi:hypothetical protein